jgi:hypothetical protein
VTVNALDADGVDRQTFNIVISAPVVVLPVFTSNAPTAVVSNHTYTYHVTVSQSGGSYGISTNAAWLTMTGATVTGLAPVTNVSLTYYVHLAFTNDNGTCNQNYNLVVTGVPSPTPEPTPTPVPNDTGTTNNTADAVSGSVSDWLPIVLSIALPLGIIGMIMGVVRRQ